MVTIPPTPDAITADYRIGFTFGDPAYGDRLLHSTIPDGRTVGATGRDMHTPPLHVSCRCVLALGVTTEGAGHE